MLAAKNNIRSIRFYTEYHSSKHLYLILNKTHILILLGKFR